MTLLQTFLVAMASFFLFDKVILPWAAEANFKGKFAEMTKIGWLAAFGFVRKFFLYAGLTFGGLWLALQSGILFGWMFNGSSAFIEGLLSSLIGLSQLFEQVSEHKGWIVLAVLGFVLFSMSILNARKHAQQVYEKLKADQKNNDLDPTPQTKQMRHINEHLIEVIRKFSQLNTIEDVSLSASEQRQKNEKLAWLKQLISNLYGLRDELDVRQRIIPEIEKQAAAKKAATNWKEKILLFFSSQGLVNAVAKSSGIVANLGIFVLVLSFVAGNGKAVSGAAAVVSGGVYEWKFASERAKLDQEWKDNLTNSQAPKVAEPWLAEDEETLNHIARSVELAFAEMFSPNDDDDYDDHDDALGVSGMGARLASYQSRANAVRYQVMQEYAKLPSGKLHSGFNVYEEGAKMSDEYERTAKAKKWSRTYARHVVSRAPTTNFGKKVKENIRNRAKNAPRKYWEGVKASWVKTSLSFSITAKPSSVIGLMVLEEWNDIISEAAWGGSIEASVAEELMSRVGRQTLKNCLELKADELVYNLFMGKPAEAAMADLKQPGTFTTQFMEYSMDDISFPKAAARAEEFAQYPPCMDFNDMDAAKTRQARTALQNFAESVGIEARALAEAVSDYTFHFPGQAGMEYLTMAAEMSGAGSFMPEAKPMSSGGGGGNRSPGGASANPQTSGGKPWKYSGSSSGSGRSILASTRARSFSMLRGFRRIGGVLIGREAENSGKSGADFRDIYWEERPDNTLEIFLQKKDGQKISAGIFPKKIIPQALAYVADGRLITATMIKAQPLPYLKIFTHPALTNTELGCYAIGLDRFVDKYASTDDNAQIGRSLEAFRFQSLLYEYVAIKLIHNKLIDISKGINRSRGSSSEEARQLAQQIHLVSQKLSQIKMVLQESWDAGFPLMNGGQILDDEIRSHVAAKPAYYNQRVVACIKRGLQQCGGSLNNFQNYVAGESVAFESMNDLLKVQTEQWSGVREINYFVDENLSFMRPRAGQNPNLFPLNFIRQIVYVPTEMGNDDGAAEQSDENPWEFPELKNSGTIEAMVWRGIQLNEKDRGTFESVKSFTLLQRLFRSAFSGDLGTDFPIEKLYFLMEATKPFMVASKTPTWHVKVPKEYEELIVNQFSDASFRYYQVVKETLGVNLHKNQNPCN